MKLIIIALLLGVISVKAQTIERQVIGAAGTSITDGSVIVDFTVGEQSITTITDGNSILIQGFHQEPFSNQILDVEDNNILDGFTLYPNPVLDQFVIWGLGGNETYRLEIFNVRAQKIKTIEDYRSEPVSVFNCRAGVYFVKITSDSASKIIRIVKRR